MNNIKGGQILEHEGKTIYNASIKEGIAIDQRDANFETAGRLSKMGLSDNDIHRATNISFNDLQRL